MRTTILEVVGRSSYLLSHSDSWHFCQLTALRIAMKMLGWRTCLPLLHQSLLLLVVVQQWCCFWPCHSNDWCLLWRHLHFHSSPEVIVVTSSHCCSYFQIGMRRRRTAGVSRGGTWASYMTGHLGEMTFDPVRTLLFCNNSQDPSTWFFRAVRIPTWN